MNEVTERPEELGAVTAGTKGQGELWDLQDQGRSLVSQALGLIDTVKELKESVRVCFQRLS